MFNIIPQPNQIIISKGKPSFSLSPDTTVTKTDFTTEFRDFVKKQFDIRIHREISDDVSIKLVKSSEVAGEEGYTLISRDGRIYIYGKNECGIFYGLQTLKQLLLQGDGNIYRTHQLFAGYIIFTSFKCEIHFWFTPFLNLVCIRNI